ncbi:hypothetical protein CK203_066946 [Vitis vinifera]|uniref:Reverse transcriptase zinc-binding domain-containing protein n=1 Tax=Vitis vinifera TaxID=29760 RepID=A0A438F6D3_VITVI|nr:hypothetical protein CK203_066946 [Vitis vinifera]
MIEEMWDQHSGQGDWNLVFVRDFNDWEMDMVGDLLHTLRGHSLPWRMTQLNGGKEEMVFSGLKMLTGCWSSLMPQCFPQGNMVDRVPTKVCFFAWEATWGKVPKANHVTRRKNADQSIPSLERRTEQTKVVLSSGINSLFKFFIVSTVERQSAAIRAIVMWSLNICGQVAFAPFILQKGTATTPMSIAYPDCSAAVPSFGGFEFSSKAVKTSLLGADNLQIRDFVLEEPSETQMMGLQDAFQTPGKSVLGLPVVCLLPAFQCAKFMPVCFHNQIKLQWNILADDFSGF